MSGDDCLSGSQDYFECEGVEEWHINFSIILVLLTLITAFLILTNSVLIWNFSYFNSLRYRCPTTIMVWGLLAEIYLFSRLIYAGILLSWWNPSVELDVFIYTIRGFGLNGGLIAYMIRAWMYYVTYKLDQYILNNTKSWLSKYKNTICNNNQITHTKTN
eukprot:376198_1